ncbi:MAG: RDD family protein [Buchananella hordeovulneris]|nr:RDD family protein [Buchananella hordeovulneris]
MAEMTSPGGTKIAVEAHLDGVVAASVGKRAGARFLDGVFVGIFYMLGSVVGGAMALGATGQNSGDGAVAGLFVGMLIGLIYPLLMLIGLVRVGASPGMQMVGVRWVCFTDATNPGASAFGKRFVEALVSVVTFGIGPLIIWFASMDEHGRHWFDRSSNIIAIDVKLGRNPITTSAPVEEEKKEEVQPWNATASAAADLPVMPPPNAGEQFIPNLPATGRNDAFIEAAPWTSQENGYAGFSPNAATSGNQPSDFGAQPPSRFAAPSLSQPAGLPDPSGLPAPYGAPLPATPPAIPTAAAVPKQPAAGSFAPPVDSFTRFGPGNPASLAVGAPSSSVEEAGLDRTIAAVKVMRRLVAEDGSSVTLTGPIVVGRAPVAGPNRPGTREVAMADPDRSISKTHAFLNPTAGGVVVEDLHSTNGTSIIPAGGLEQPLSPGVPVVAPFGAVIKCGDRKLVVHES